MKKALSLLLLVSGPALADDAAVLACRALPDAASRLACYDAMPVGAAPAAPAAAPAAAPRAAAAGAITGFGSETVKKKVDELPKSMESTIVGEFDGWGPNTRIKLANGQVWRVIDDSSAVLPRRSNTRVRVERNLFGTLFLSVEGSNNSAKVRRIE
ncbi:hypothetical protein [Massilia sp. GCM10023247]|uniref:hypothetical protein n=1 Tax=Massilia sp. GCM10023247 TaxID=3252643 RepID=UPI0036079D03